MSRNNPRIVVLVLGIAAATVYGIAAQEKYIPGPVAANAKARRDAAMKVYEASWQHHRQDPDGQSRGDLDYWHDWSVRWMQAERDLRRTRVDHIAALEGHMKRMQSWKKRFEAGAKDGSIPAHEAVAAEFFALEAEDLLAAARAEGK